MNAQNLPEYRSVYRSLHRPLTACGVDRRLFFLALLVGAATFNLFYSFLAGCLMFVLIYGVAWVTSTRDPQMLRALELFPEAKSIAVNVGSGRASE